MTTTVAASVHLGTDAVPAKTWDEVNRSFFYTSHAWTAAFERHGHMVPTITMADGAAAIGYLTQAGQGNPRYSLPWLYQIDPDHQPSSMVVVGGCAGYTGHLPASPHADPAARRGCVSALKDAMPAEAMLFAHFTQNEALDLVQKRILPGPITPVLGMVTAELDLTGVATFDDYLTELSGTSRSAIRRDIRRFQRSGLTLETKPLQEVIDDCAPLLGETQGHHGADPSTQAAAGYLRLCCAGELADIATAFIARQDGQPVAFSLGYPWRGNMCMRVAGFRYAIAHDTGSYFETYFHEPIRRAIDLGLETVDFGGESLEGKLRHGSHLEPRWSLTTAPAVDPDLARRLTSDRSQELSNRFKSHRGAEPSATWVDVHERLLQRRAE